MEWRGAHENIVVIVNYLAYIIDGLICPFITSSWMQKTGGEKPAEKVSGTSKNLSRSNNYVSSQREAPLIETNKMSTANPVAVVM
jgi:myosin-crossreactive antigen